MQRAADSATAALERLRDWFRERGWSSYPFQETTWAHQREGRSGLVQVPTGAGKTYAAYLGSLASWMDAPPRGIALLYLTPLRAMTRDLEKALKAPVEALQLPLRVESRTGDTASSTRARQKRQLPHVLLTTPESLSLLLSYADARERFAGLHTVIVDEWHELLASKRGVQAELALARLRRWNPGLRTWALSATVAEPERAAEAACGIGSQPVLVQAPRERRLVLTTLLPRQTEALPWAGHFGLKMLPTALEHLDPAWPTILFTNTRAQAELWFEGLRSARPDWEPLMALHHGSLDRDARDAVESGLKSGALRLVVSTSSLDLGVDFSPVERIVQIGSPKGVARLLQRAGRARHRPGVSTSEILCVPTHMMQLLEFSAAREAAAANRLESVELQPAPLDVLCQHLITCAYGGGFEAEVLFDEVRTALSYAALEREAFDWCIDHLSTGGKTLSAYEEHRRIVRDSEGLWTGPRKFALRHRSTVGTIASDGMVQVAYTSGQRLGAVEESFVARLKRGDVFLFAGKVLEFESMREMTARVRPARKKKQHVPHYAGGRMPLSNQLSAALRAEVEAAAEDRLHSPELEHLAETLDIQRRLSALPRRDQILIELTQTREGHHCFLFPFEGYRVHQGLSALLAYRLGQQQAATFALSCNDYGFELLCPEPYPFEALLCGEARTKLFATDALLADTLASINVSELARRQFRTIARVAGLVFEGYPHQRKGARQLQASSGLIYDVFARYDPDNRFLQQAQQEVLQEQFEQKRLEKTLQRLQRETLLLRSTPHPTPLSLPLVADRTSLLVSTETLEARVQRMQALWLK